MSLVTLGALVPESKYHSKKNISCIRGLQALGGRGGPMVEMREAGLGVRGQDELRAQASPEVASQLPLTVPKQRCRRLCPDFPMFQREEKKWDFYVESPVSKYYLGLQDL